MLSIQSHHVILANEFYIKHWEKKKKPSNSAWVTGCDSSLRVTVVEGMP